MAVTKPNNRPSRAEIHMMTALMWAQRSWCKRPNGHVGAVITTSDLRRVLSIGYNGPARGLANDRCRNTAGTCGCIHAEANAIAHVDGTTPNKALFCTVQPCEMCAQLIVQANISKVYFLKDYRNTEGAKILADCNVTLERVDLPDRVLGGSIVDAVVVPSELVKLLLKDLRSWREIAKNHLGCSPDLKAEVTKEIEQMSKLFQSYEDGGSPWTLKQPGWTPITVTGSSAGPT